VCVLAPTDGVVGTPVEAYPELLGGFGQQWEHPKEIGVPE
jgi:hypothetical protein